MADTERVTRPKRAGGYTRVSTLKQAREGVSIEEQPRRVEDYISERGWELVEVFVEAGVSGRKAENRPELQRLLGRLDELDVLVIPKIDRFGRNFRESVALKGQLEDAGVALVAMDLNVDFTTGVGTLIWANMAAVAEMESEAIGERVSDVTAANAAKGEFPGSRFPPYGYQRADGGLVVNPAEAVTVVRIYNETVAGRSLRKIAQGLHADGIGTQNGARWEQGTIRRILGAHVYRGAVELKGVVYENGLHQAIIEPELWAAVAALRAARKRAPGAGRGRPPKGSHLLINGMLRCGDCGSAMSPRTYRTGKEVYECRGRRDNGIDSCSMMPLARERVDRAVLEEFTTNWHDLQATRAGLAENYDRSLAAARALREQAEREVARKRSQLDRAQRDYLAETLSADTYEELRAQLIPEHEAAQGEAERLRDQQALIEEQGSTIEDAEAETLRRLAQLHEAIVGPVRDATGVEALRAALQAVFAHFVLSEVAVYGPGLPADGEVTGLALFPFTPTGPVSVDQERKRVPLRLEQRGRTG